MRSVANEQLHLRLPGRETIAALLDWYDRERRDLPWRPAGADNPTPTASGCPRSCCSRRRSKPSFPTIRAFLARWPTVEALAEAPPGRRPRGLGRAWLLQPRPQPAQVRARSLPSAMAAASRATEAELRELPGIGPYTAAAIAAIAFGASAMPVDGNIERVVARLFAVRQPLPARQGAAQAPGADLRRAVRASGDCAQALMDLGATVCTPKRPSCLHVPARRRLRCPCARASRRACRSAPRKPSGRRGVGLAFLALREDGCVLLRRRPEAGLLGGMLEVPSTDWSEALPPLKEALRGGAGAGRLVGGARHRQRTPSRTSGWRCWSIAPSCRSNASARPSGPMPERCQWVARRDLHRAALPSVMRKIIAHGLAEQ